MADGSTLATVKAALVDRLRARAGLANVNVSYQAPVHAVDLKGGSGAFDAIWFEDADDDYEIVILQALPLAFDEEYSVEAVIQALRPSSDGSQQEADEAATAMLGEVFGVLAADPTLGITAFPRCEALPEGWRHVTGVLPKGTGHGSRYELRIRVNARLALT